MQRAMILLAAMLIGALPTAVFSETAPTTQTQPAAKKAPKKPTSLPTNQYSTEADAKQRCGAESVVWVNLRSKIYHLAGTRDYGKTKRGAYMCKAEADRSGYRGVKPASQKKKK